MMCYDDGYLLRARQSLALGIAGYPVTLGNVNTHSDLHEVSHRDRTVRLHPDMLPYATDGSKKTSRIPLDDVPVSRCSSTIVSSICSCVMSG